MKSKTENFNKHSWPASHAQPLVYIKTLKQFKDSKQER